MYLEDTVHIKKNTKELTEHIKEKNTVIYRVPFLILAIRYHVSKSRYQTEVEQPTIDNKSILNL